MIDHDPSPIVGIDLGTTNSLVAFCDESGPRVLTVQNESILPSAIRFNPDGSTTIGAQARDEAPAFPDTTVTSIKRLMGRSLDDAQADLPYLGYSVVAGEHNTARVAIPNPGGEPRIISPQEVSAMILGELKRRAEIALAQPVRKAVVTVPAYFDDAQRQATKDAARLADIEVLRLLNEPTAAALAYGP
ncbi:MAG: Hsp70 family protein, partial [Phycisphaerales bacterium]|nr:Hsp70 family protein [Phycisphaerales bacterium]